MSNMRMGQPSVGVCGNEIGRQCPILYYEHIIRDESELNRIREYVINNPAGWDKDEENPAVANDVCQTDFCGTINCANE